MEENKDKLNEPLILSEEFENVDQFKDFDYLKKYRNIEKMNYALVQGKVLSMFSPKGSNVMFYEVLTNNILTNEIPVFVSCSLTRALQINVFPGCYISAEGSLYSRKKLVGVKKIAKTRIESSKIEKLSKENLQELSYTLNANVCEVVGRVACAPFLKQTKNGKNVTVFEIAIEKDNAIFDYIPIVAFANQSKYIIQNGKVGDKMAVKGHLNDNNVLIGYEYSKPVFERSSVVVADNAVFLKY